jgi:hypothetical protein
VWSRRNLKACIILIRSLYTQGKSPKKLYSGTGWTFLQEWANGQILCMKPVPFFTRSSLLAFLGTSTEPSVLGRSTRSTENDLVRNLRNDCFHTVLAVCVSTFARLTFRNPVVGNHLCLVNRAKCCISGSARSLSTLRPLSGVTSCRITKTLTSGLMIFSFIPCTI